MTDGREAERLLADETFKKTLARLEAQYVETWKQAKTVEEREVTHARLKALGDIRGTLNAMAGARDMALAEDKRFNRNQPKR